MINANNIEDVDWRVNLAFVVPKDKNPNLNIQNDRVGYISASIYEGKITHPYAIPSATALFLEISSKNYYEAENAKRRFYEKKYKGQIKSELVYEYFEYYMTSILMCFSAIESFCNYQIKDDYYYEEKHNKIWLALGKTEIERKIDTKTKLSTILPDIYKVKPPNKLQVWSKFCALKKIRDRIVHLKTHDTHSLNNVEASIWDHMIKNKNEPYFKYSIELMRYYFKDENLMPAWLKKCPLL